MRRGEGSGVESSGVSAAASARRHAAAGRRHRTLADPPRPFKPVPVWTPGRLALMLEAFVNGPGSSVGRATDFDARKTRMPIGASRGKKPNRVEWMPQYAGTPSEPTPPQRRW